MQEEGEDKHKLHKEITEKKKMIQHDKNKLNLEHFFPMQNDDNSDAFNLNTRQKKTSNENKTMKNKSECMDMYVPQFEAVGNVCSPVATFQGELNAQGLNYPEGFDHNVDGAPL